MVGYLIKLIDYFSNNKFALESLRVPLNPNGNKKKGFMYHAL